MRCFLCSSTDLIAAYANKQAARNINESSARKSSIKVLTFWLEITTRMIPITVRHTPTIAAETENICMEMPACLLSLLLDNVAPLLLLTHRHAIEPLDRLRKTRFIILVLSPKSIPTKRPDRGPNGTAGDIGKTLWHTPNSPLEVPYALEGNVTYGPERSIHRRSFK
jgi:hypothetical protein